MRLGPSATELGDYESQASPADALSRVGARGLREWRLFAHGQVRHEQAIDRAQPAWGPATSYALKNSWSIQPVSVPG